MTAFSVVAVSRWATTYVQQGGSIVVTPADPPANFGVYLGLFVRDGHSRTLEDVFAVVVHGESEPGPLDPRVTGNLRPQPGGPVTGMDASLAAAWVAANDSIGVEVPFTSRLVVGDDQPSDAAGQDIAEFGVVPGDPVRWSDGDLVVVTDEAVVVVPTDLPVNLVESFDVPLGQPPLTIPAGVRGLSAGLLQGLVYVDYLTEGDLSAGFTVAATGALSPEGFVSQVGGVVHKAEAAVAAGADVLFVPRFADAETEAAVDGVTAGHLVVVEVNSLRSALSWLCAHGGAANGVC